MQVNLFYKIYSLSFDPTTSDEVGLHEIISKSPKIQNWWHYLPGTYLLKSQWTLETIQNEIVKKWPQQRFLLMEVNYKNRNGWLPEKAWKWLRQFDKPK